MKGGFKKWEKETERQEEARFLEVLTEKSVPEKKIK